MNNILIRNAKIHDIKAIMRIEDICFDIDTREEPKVYLERIKTFCDGFLIAEVNQEMIGFISSEIWKSIDEINLDLFKVGHSISRYLDLNGSILYISSFAVNPKFQGNGFGQLLLKKLLDRILVEYRNVNESYLLVGNHWKNAFNIYLKNGYKQVTVFENFFGGDKVAKYDGIIMHKFFNKET
ncbi:MAG: GNAT family N-acetyltransferase [Candidatus Izemoplasmatales bacterium]